MTLGEITEKSNRVKVSIQFDGAVSTIKATANFCVIVCDSNADIMAIKIHKRNTRARVHFYAFRVSIYASSTLQTE